MAYHNLLPTNMQDEEKQLLQQHYEQQQRSPRHNPASHRTYSSSSFRSLAHYVLLISIGFTLHANLTSLRSTTLSVKDVLEDSLPHLPLPLLSSTSSMNKVKVPTCPAQPPPLAPSRDWRPDLSDAFQRASAQRLSEAVQIATVSYDYMGEPEQDERYKVFGDFHAYLNKTFPLVHARAELRKVNTWGLLYKFEGSDEKLKPGLLAAHQDVVPVAEETLGQWTHPPFEGYIDEEQGLVWGRGSSDDKNMLVAVFEALEKLSEEGWKPRRTLYIASGFDEEVGGVRGAIEIGKVLAQDLGSDYPIEYIIDEGGLGIGQDQGIDVAMPGVGEKGYVDVKMQVKTPGGHSSMPPDSTGIGMMSRLITALEDNPHKANLAPDNPVLTHLICLSDAIARGQQHSSDSQQEGFILSKKMRSYLRTPSRWARVAAAIDAHGTRVQRFIIKTSQAVDIIAGGAKSNALPESVSAIVNQRISVESSVDAVKQRLVKVLSPVAKELRLNIDAYGDKIVHVKEEDAAGTLVLTTDLFSEPTAVSPTDNDAFRMLASTVKHVFPGTDGKERLVTPVVFTGNTDVRRYSFAHLSENIWRFSPSTFESRIAHVHTVDERSSILSHAQMARFIYNFVLNFDEVKQAV